MRKFVLPVMAAVAVLTGACGEDLTGVSSELVGTYQLVSVNGQPLPYIIPGPGTPVSHTGGELELDGEGNFDRTFQTPVSGGGPGEAHVLGTWERVGSAVQLTRQDGTRLWAEYREDDDAIIIHDEDDTAWRYER
jgi:hypothetical protein